MRYRPLGAAGAKVSTLCLGAMTFGEADAQSFMHQVGCDDATAHAILDRAVEGGINFIDTADVYGQDGLSERVLGAWLADRAGVRDRLVLATKVRFTMGAGPNASGASRYRIVRCVEDSLRRLGTDRIDLYQIHMQDLAVDEDETLRALDDLVTAGKVVYLGCSNYAAYRLVDSLWRARAADRARFVTLQAQYNLVERGLEREHVPLCRQWGLGILPWSPLAAGFLSGKYRAAQAPPDGSRLARWRESLGPLRHAATLGDRRGAGGDGGRARRHAGPARAGVAPPQADGDQRDLRRPHGGPARRQPGGGRGRVVGRAGGAPRSGLGLRARVPLRLHRPHRWRGVVRPRVLYLHGFASGPASTKGVAVATALDAAGFAVERLDLRVPSLERLRLSAAIDHVVATIGDAPQVALIGSSLGGLIAARVAERVGAVAALVLLAPAFRMAERWAARLGPDGVAAWRKGRLAADLRLRPALRGPGRRRLPR
jgi:aryl-alcohol dehydrogenase-like predicted oxidoreductase